jgi:hypothetical protein
MAADRGAVVAGIDASSELIGVAAERTPGADFRVGDLEELPWGSDSFDVVTGFSSFQFADDKVRALTEAARVSRDLIAVIIPTRVSASGIAAVFKPLFPLFPPEALESMGQSGMFALSEPGSLDETLAGAMLVAIEDDEIEFAVAFDSIDTAVRGFIGAGPMALAIGRSGEKAVSDAVRQSLVPFTDVNGDVALPAWYRVVLAQAEKRGNVSRDGGGRRGESSPPT